MMQERFARYTYVYRFIVVGGTAFVFNYFLLNFFEGSAHLGKTISEILGMVITLQLTFICHDRWTYVEHREGNYLLSVPKRYLAYMLSNSFGSVMTIVLFVALSSHLSNLPALGIASGISMFWNFAVNKLIIWRHRHAAVIEVD